MPLARPKSERKAFFGTITTHTKNFWTSSKIGLYDGIADVVSGASAGYSNQLLRKSYADKCINIRSLNSGDVGFSNNKFSGAEWDALTNSGANIAYATKLYDQIATYDFAQFTAADQPKVARDGYITSDGVSEYMISSAKFGTGDNFSVVFSFKSTETSDSQRIVAHENSTTLNRSYSIMTRPSTNQLRIIAWISGGKVIDIDTGNIYDNINRLISISYDSSVGFKCYVDGVQQNIAINATGTIDSSTIDMSILAQQNGVSATNASIDTVVYYKNKTLSTQDHVDVHAQWIKNAV